MAMPNNSINVLFFILLAITACPLALSWGFTIEAEDMTLSHYSIKSSPYASNGQYLQTNGGPNIPGTATTSFVGESGFYTIETYYFDETDGQSPFVLSINGVVVDSWLADASLGSAGVDASNLTYHSTVEVNLVAGDQIKIQGTHHGSEYARLDKLELRPSGIVSAESAFKFNVNDGLPLTLFLSGRERLSGVTSNAGFYFGVFDGYAFAETAYRNIVIKHDSIEVSEDGGLPRFIFQINEYDTYVTLSLIDIEGLPLNDSSVALRLRIPVNSRINVVDLDTHTVSDSSSSSFSIYWTQFGTRSGVFPHGSLELYVDQ